MVLKFLKSGRSALWPLEKPHQTLSFENWKINYAILMATTWEHDNKKQLVRDLHSLNYKIQLLSMSMTLPQLGHLHPWKDRIIFLFFKLNVFSLCYWMSNPRQDTSINRDKQMDNQNYLNVVVQEDEIFIDIKQFSRS